jgi:hypothetical protein
MRGLQRVAAAEAGRLLRVLFLRLGSLSPDSGKPVMLLDARLMGSPRCANR